MDLNVKFGLETCFKHFRGHFLMIFIYLRPLQRKLEKIFFLKKMHFLRFLGIFDVDRFGCKNAQKITKIMKNFENAFFSPSR